MHTKLLFIHGLSWDFDNLRIIAIDTFDLKRFTIITNKKIFPTSAVASKGMKSSIQSNKYRAAKSIMVQANGTNFKMHSRYWHKKVSSYSTFLCQYLECS